VSPLASSCITAAAASDGVALQNVSGVAGGHAERREGV
jgi:hypothetical protein